MFQIRHSRDQGFYYLLEIDKEGNEKLLEENRDLKALKANPAIKNIKVEVVEEKPANSN